MIVYVLVSWRDIGIFNTIDVSVNISYLKAKNEVEELLKVNGLSIDDEEVEYENNLEEDGYEQFFIAGDHYTLFKREVIGELDQAASNG